jgi:serine/threonine protein kinase
MASQLNHPNIATIHEIGEAAGNPYIVMEYVEGQTLAERLEVGPLALSEIIDIVCRLPKRSPKRTNVEWSIATSSPRT